MTLKEELKVENNRCVSALFESGISYAVDNMATSIAHDIICEFDKCDWEPNKISYMWIDGSKRELEIKHKHFLTTIFIPEDYHNLYVIVDVYYITKENAKIAYNILPLDGGKTALVGNKSRICISIPAVNGQLKEYTVLNTVSHEILHLYQALRANKSVITTNDIYKTSTSGGTQIDYAIYITDKREIDANMHELFQSMLHTPPESIDDLQQYSVYDIYRQMIEQTIPDMDSMTDIELSKIANRYNMTPQKFRDFIKKRAKDAISKLHKTLVDYFRTYSICEATLREIPIIGRKQYYNK